MNLSLGTSIASTFTVAVSGTYFALSRGFTPAATLLATTALSLKCLSPVEDFLMSKVVWHCVNSKDQTAISRYMAIKDLTNCPEQIDDVKNHLSTYLNIAKGIKVVAAMAIACYANDLLLSFGSEVLTFTAAYWPAAINLSPLFSAVAFVGYIPFAMLTLKTLALAALVFKCSQFIAR